MQLMGFTRAAEFENAAGEWLAAAERHNNPVITAVSAAARNEVSGCGWLVMEDAAPRLALFQHPAHYLMLSTGEPEAAAWAATKLESDLPGASGPAAVVEAFAKSWSERAGKTAILDGAATFFTAERITPFRQPPGDFRPATESEFDRLLAMGIEAAKDMNLPKPEQNPGVVGKGLRRAIAEGRQFVWTDGPSIRAMACYVVALPGRGARIRGVYTPPEVRGQGYGTAVSGSLAKLLLDTGQAWVSLFADNANPISTGIYQRLGFQPEYLYRWVKFE